MIIAINCKWLWWLIGDRKHLTQLVNIISLFDELHPEQQTATDNNNNDSNIE